MIGLIPGMIVNVIGQAASGDVAASGSEAADTVLVQSVWDFVLKGGPMMIPILACSLIALTVAVERWISLSRHRVIPGKFVRDLRKKLKDRDEGPSAALAYCKKNRSHIANIFAAAIRRMGQPIELLERHIADAGAREVRKLRKRLRVLSVVGAIAPLMGLLGTIFGMIEAFQTVAASGESLGKTELLAKGIYEAMITTAAGLLLAIPVVVAYHILAAKIDQLVGEMDELAADFVEQFALKPVAVDSVVSHDSRNGDEEHAVDSEEESEEPVALSLRDDS